MRLDVGCGDHPTGDVNCDLFIGETPHLDKHRGRVNPKRIPNFVRCDVNHLPFRDSLFSFVNCSHVLEHEGVNPTKTLKELLRVCNSRVQIVVPHRFQRISWLRYKQFQLHCRFFNVANLSAWLKRHTESFEVKVLYRCFPNSIFRFVCLPWEIKAIIYVGKAL